MAKKPDDEIKRGPKGGRKHTPGRDHDSKSHKSKTSRHQKLARKKREKALEELRRQWKEWDGLTKEQKKFRFDLRPKGPRPEDESKESRR